MKQMVHCCASQKLANWEAHSSYLITKTLKSDPSLQGKTT